MNYREVRRCFSRKGFEKEEGSNHERYWYVHINGVKSQIQTVLSRQAGGRTVSQGLQSDIASQLSLSNAQFREFVNCSITKEDYDAIVTAKLKCAP